MISGETTAAPLKKEKPLTPLEMRRLKENIPNASAVVAIGGHQYRVQPGEVISIEKLPLEPGDEFAFEKVLLVNDEGEIQLGEPYLEGQTVKAEVLRNSKGKKIRIFKFNAKKHTRLCQGHRQKYTDIHITQIGSKTVKSRMAVEAAE